MLERHALFSQVEEHSLNKPKEGGGQEREMKWHCFSKTSALGHQGPSFQPPLSFQSHQGDFLHSCYQLCWSHVHHHQEL